MGTHALDPRTKEAEQEVQRIINLQLLANNLSDAFIDYKGVRNRMYMQLMHWRE